MGRHRNIPACAGKTSVTGVVTVFYPEHPRVRGENRFSTACGAIRIGTSPRARGKRFWAKNEAFSTRNIPACAGKTPRRHRHRRYSQEHPRVRGENFVIGAEVER